MKNITIEEMEFAPLFTQEQLLGRIAELASEINQEYADKNPVFLGVLNGCFMFFSDLMKSVNVACEISFVKLASYSGINKGEISDLIGLGMSLAGRHVVIVEDIVDSGLSIQHLLRLLEGQHIASVSVACLLLKPDNLQVDLEVLDYVGFKIAPEFVVGYGLDYNGGYRNLPHIYSLVPSE